MSFYLTSVKKMISHISKRGVTPSCAGSTQQIWASGLVVMTSRLQRGDRRFNSGLAHFHFRLESVSRLSQNTDSIDTPSRYENKEKVRVDYYPSEKKILIRKITER